MRHSSALRSTADWGFDLIPLTVAEREHVFFFGTLMHPAVLETVLDRKVAAEECVTGTLKGYMRVRARDVLYPVLVPHERGEVDGVMLKTPSVRDLIRINHFEDEEYFADRVELVNGDGHPRQAWIFKGLDVLEPTNEPWRVEEWARNNLESYLEEVREMMVDAPR